MTWADAFTAVGTVAAAVIALVLALAPRWRRRRNRPRLIMVTGRGEPFQRPIHANGNLVDELRLRVGVRNTGRSPASDVRAILQNWWQRNPNGDWDELDVDPLPMKWISIRPGDERATEPTVTIVPGTMDYVDIIIWRPTGIELLVDDGRQALFERRSAAVGVWRVAFVLAGTNIAPEQLAIEFECDGKNFISRVHAASPPDTSRHVGLVRLLDELAPG